MQKISPSRLTRFINEIFIAAGATPENGEIVARSLVLANLTGHDSHGISRTIRYVNEIEKGTLQPQATPSLVQEAGATAQVDGGYTFGQVSAKFAIETAIQKGKEHGVAAVTLGNSFHVGRVGEWVGMAAAAGMIGLAWTNVASPRPWMTPHGGIGRLIGTNPFSAALPIANHPPFVLDFATTVVAEGKVNVARIAQTKLPDGWILDAAGQPSNDPNDLYADGMLNPAGAYKGYGLGLLVELLGGILSGSGWPALPDGRRFENGMLFITVDIERFRPLLHFMDDGETLIKRAKAITPIQGSDGVLYPGEPEYRMQQERSTNGIPLEPNLWLQLSDLAERLDVVVPEI